MNADKNTDKVLGRIESGIFGKDDLVAALSLKGAHQGRLFAFARSKRSEFFPGRAVEVRSVIEVSNICERKCAYCGIHSQTSRFTIGEDRLVDIARHIYSFGRRVLLIQSGENTGDGYIGLVSSGIMAVKKEFPDLVIILCLGDLSVDQYKRLKASGAERYILKFETSNPDLYSRIKPGDTLMQRVRSLENIIELGFETGTGNIVGLPGQTKEDLAGDLLFIGGFKLAMASCSVFIPGKGSEMEAEVPGDIDTALNYMALQRIMYPHLLIPTTSSLEKAGAGGQYLGLMAGANTVTIHDGTPKDLEGYFPIYSSDRFRPDREHIASIVQRAGLSLP
ncbi:MAG: radical SAM protein [Candidatus Omnitrophica bacterium]|nr:radical SAM protein [Candidatus Omnitrophota bacterium]